jgi:glycosyltransferase involved in cell wall biosynthesis
VLDVSVIVPTRNAAHLVDASLASIAASEPRELIVVDGCSSDDTVARAERHGARVVSDGGAGLPRARMIGAEAATSATIALIDADVVLPPGALEALLAEREAGGYVGLQAAQESVSGPGYWGRALVRHHRTSRSKGWFGVVATVIDREAFLRYGLDDRFSSGEDIDLRYRLERDHVRVGVSDHTVVEHRYGDTFAFAKDQFLQDGAGLGRMARVHRGRALLLAGLPAAAAARGIALTIARREVRFVPYYLTYAVLNYAGMIKGLRDHGLRGAGA